MRNKIENKSSKKLTVVNNGIIKGETLDWVKGQSPWKKEKWVVYLKKH